MASSKVPRRPPHPLVFGEEYVRPFDERLVRIHRTIGEHPLAWNQPREHGPLDRARWDAHLEPRSDQPDRAVIYAAAEVPTAFAEAFQQTRRIRASRGQHLSAWTPARPLRLLDLRGDWPIHNHASAALQSAPRPACRAWARAIFEECPDDAEQGGGIDGLISISTMRPGNVVTLWPAALDSFPPGPEFSRALADEALAGTLDEVAQVLRWPKPRRG